MTAPIFFYQLKDDISRDFASAALEHLFRRAIEWGDTQTEARQFALLTMKELETRDIRPFLEELYGTAEGLTLPDC